MELPAEKLVGDLSFETRLFSVACGQLLRQVTLHAEVSTAPSPRVQSSCVKLGKNGAEMLEMLRKAYGDDTVKQSQTFMGHKRFWEGWESVNDDDRSGRSSASQTDDSVHKVREVLDEDWRLSVRMIAEECGIPKAIVQCILTEDLQLWKVCSKMVPKVLMSEMKEQRLLKCQELHERYKMDPEFSDRVTTGDKTGIFEYDPESKRQSSEWHTTESPRPKKARMRKLRIKAMLNVFF